MTNLLRGFFENYQPLSDHDFALLQNGLTARTLEKGAIFLRANELCEAVAIVRRGMLRAFRLRADGEEITETFYLENSLAADHHSFAKETPAEITIEAVEPSEIFEISRRHVEAVCAVSPAWRETRRLIVEAAFTAAQTRIANLLAQTPEQRYLNLIRENPDIARRAPQFMLASYLGVKPESLSRIRRRLARRKKQFAVS